MDKSLQWVLVIVFVVALAVGGYFIYSQQKASQSRYEQDRQDQQYKQVSDSIAKAREDCIASGGTWTGVCLGT